MKFTFKKVASVLASAVMLTSTIGFAAAATYPTPFTDGTAVVYGTNAASSDMDAAIDIYDQLSARVGSTTSASVSGEAKPIETSSQALYLGDTMSTTKETFSVDELPTILADDSVTDDSGKEYTIKQRIVTPNTTVIYGDGPDNLDLPIVYADFDDAGYKFSFRITFPTAVNVSKLTDEAITLFGKQYTFTGSTSGLSEQKITLFEKATSVVVNDGESVTADGHTISVAVEDTNTATVNIDGSSQSKDEGWSGKIGSVDVYIKNIVGPNVAGVSRYVELYLNSNQLTLEDGNEVTLGSEDVSGTAVQFSNASGKVSQIDIDISPYGFDDSIKYLKMGDSITDPVFGAVKLSVASINPELEDAERDYILFKPSGETRARLKFTNRAGKEYDMDVLRPSKIRLNATFSAMRNSSHNGNSSGVASTGTHTYNATELGVDSDYNLITTAGTGKMGDANMNISVNDYFITCNNDYTQIWKLEKIDITGGDQYVRVRDQGSGTTAYTEISLSGTTNGSTGTLNLGDGSSATIKYLGGTNRIQIDKACDYLYTEKGAKIDLRTADAPVSNLSEIRIFEETAYNGGAFTDNGASALGKNITIRTAHVVTARSGNDLYIRDTMGGSTDGTDLTDYWKDDVGDYDKYYLTKYGTYVKQSGDTDKQVEFFYPENAMSLGVYLGESSSSITPDTGGQIMRIKDNEVSSASDKHLIVVGGSCVNTVAAKILGSDSPLCGEAFTAVTNVAEGGYIVKVVESPYNAVKVAMLVAGYEAADTTAAAKRAMVIDGVDTTVGSEEIYPVSA